MRSSPHRPAQCAAWLRRGLLLGGLLLLGLWLQAQDGRLKRAHEAYEAMDYAAAIPGYVKALEKQFDKRAMLRLADCYRLMQNYRKAAEVYSKIVNLNQIDPINYFYFAQSLMNMGMYPEAAKWFDRYAKAVPSDPRGAQFAESCRNIPRYFADSAEVSISPFPHNSAAEDFSPVWYKEGILFSSSRGSGELVDRPLERGTQAFLDLYYCRMAPDGEKFTRPALVKGRLNTRFHEGTCAWDSIHQLAYFTRNNFFEGKKTSNSSGIMNLKLFYADVPATGPWSNVRSMPFNSDEHSVGHAAVVPGGDMLVFISDRPGGYGGTDLYSSRRVGDAWSTPENLGPTVNTPGNEMFPYISPDHILYFSSDGLGGLGGLDIFTCPLDSSRTLPQNLGAPINSAADDFGYVVSAVGGWGMFSSNRPGGRGSDDMYIFRYNKPRWNGVVMDSETRLPVPNARVSLHLPAVQRSLSGITNAQGVSTQLLQRDMTYELMVEAEQYRILRAQVSTYGAAPGDVLEDTLWLERPAVLVVTKILDPATGFPIANAQVNVVGTKLRLMTDSTGTVSFYYDPYPTLAQKSIACPPVAAPDYCFLFTDEGFSEFDTLKLTYEWSFGDGSKATGLEVKHCYKAAGTYQVALNLLDATGNIFMNQSTYDLEVRRPVGLIADGPDTVTVGVEAIYSAEGSTLEGCTIDSYQWEWDNGPTYLGATMHHMLTKPGIYTLRLSVGGHGDEVPRACNGCISREVVAMPAGWQRPMKVVRDSLRTVWTGDPAKPAHEAVNIPCAPQAPEHYCFSFTDAGEQNADSLPFIYRWDLGDGNLREGVTVEHCYAQPGIYNVRLEILDPISRQQLSLRNDYVLDVQDLRQVFIESYDTVALGRPARLDAFQSDFEGCHVQSVSWNFGDGATARGPEVLHQYERAGTYRVQLFLQGADAVTGEPCSRCSYKQVQVLPDYRGNEDRDSIRAASLAAAEVKTAPDGTILLDVTKEGYAPRRIALDPLVPAGTVQDSIYLPKEQKGASAIVVARDAATGQRLLGIVVAVQDAATSRPLGEYLLADSLGTVPLDPGGNYRLLVRKQGYLTQVETVTEVVQSDRPVEVHVVLQKAEVGKSWVLHNLYYDFDQSYIRHDAAIELAKLAAFLQANPSLTVELGSHTDVRGSDAYNLQLAQARADAAVTFLKSRGIAPQRIIARGYGEQQLTNACADGVTCTEEGHQENRRTEITVLGFKDPIYSLARSVEDIWGTAPIMIPSTAETAGPFTILVGTYLQPQRPSHFATLAGTAYEVTEREVDGFWLYSYGDYPSYEAAAANLEQVRQRGFARASILAVPPFTIPDPARKTAPSAKTPSVSVPSVSVPSAKTPSVSVPSVSAPSPNSLDNVYAIQVAALGGTVAPSFLKSFGEYGSSLFEQAIAGRHVFFIGPYATAAEAQQHLAQVRSQGHPSAFLVRFEQGKKVNLDKS